MKFNDQLPRAGRKFSGIFAASLALLSCTPVSISAESPADSTSRPNILVIVVDDLGWRDVGYNGSTFYETPAIDQLSRDGLRFDDAYVAYPRCVPSRYALMTGRNPARAAIPGGVGGEVMEASETTVAEALKQAGYSTFFAGKWHLGKTPETQPQAQGFDVNIAGGSAGAVKTHFWPYGAEKGHQLGPGLEQGKQGEYLADRLTDETIRFIRGHQANSPNHPFFAVLSHYAVHTPLEGKPELVAKFRRKLEAAGGPTEPAFAIRDGRVKLHQDDPVYAAMVYSIDESVARLRTELETLGIARDTVIIFTSDHGGLSNSGADSNRRLATSNLPLRAGKGHVYEGGVRVPLLVVWPGKIAPGQVSQAFVNNTDLFPTLLGVAHLPQMPMAHLDGTAVNLADVGKREAVAYWYSPRPRPESTGDRSAAAIRDGRWKYVLSYDPVQPSSLFDLETDPFETTDLSEKHPQKVEELKGKLESWLRQVHAVEPSLSRADPDKSEKKGRGKRKKRDRQES